MGTAVDEVTVLDSDYDPVMTPRGVLVALLVVMFVTTLVDMGAGLSARGEPVLWSLLTGLLSNFLTFYWFRVDRELRAWPQSRWLSTAMVTITPLAVPYYLARSRPRGKKLRGVARGFGYLVLMLLASLAGAILGMVLS